MLYSKYHGILIIGFTLLSNLKLLKDWKTYLIGVVILVLFIPHLWWQYENDFPSYMYHMIERSAKEYKFKYTLTYVLTNLPFHGPITGILLFVFSFKNKADTSFKKALKWNLYGTMLFFFISSFKGHVEPNWTLFIIVPLLILGLEEINKLTQWKKYTVNLSIVICGILLLNRIHLIHPLFIYEKDRVWEFHGNKEFASSVFDYAQGKHVVANRYQEASILSFYAPNDNYFVPALNINSRSNQFNIWQLDSLLETKNVVFVNNYLRAELQVNSLKRKVTRLSEIKNLPRSTGYGLKVSDIKKGKKKITFTTTITRPENEKTKDDKSKINYHIRNSKGKMRYPRQIITGNKVQSEVKIYPTDESITIFLLSDELKGTVRAYDKINLKDYSD